jgi:gliding motility-associated-like protein
VSVKSLPTVDAGEDTVIIAGMTSYLQAASLNEVSFNWTPEINLSCAVCEVSAAAPSSTTEYFVRVTDSFGCQATDSKIIRVIEKCNENAVFVPNLFTPNANGRNDVLKVLGPGVDNVLSLRIYDRWGKMLFESNDIQHGWDGTYEGQLLQPGVYIYYVEVRCINGQITVKKGDVTLLR